MKKVVFSRKKNAFELAGNFIYYGKQSLRKRHSYVQENKDP